MSLNKGGNTRISLYGEKARHFWLEVVPGLTREEDQGWTDCDTSGGFKGSLANTALVFSLVFRIYWTIFWTVIIDALRSTAYTHGEHYFTEKHLVLREKSITMFIMSLWDYLPQMSWNIIFMKAYHNFVDFYVKSIVIIMLTQNIFPFQMIRPFSVLFSFFVLVFFFLIKKQSSRKIIRFSFSFRHKSNFIFLLLGIRDPPLSLSGVHVYSLSFNEKNEGLGVKIRRWSTLISSERAWPKDYRV